MGKYEININIQKVQNRCYVDSAFETFTINKNKKKLGGGEKR